jgi:hypothetical protein
MTLSESLDCLVVVVIAIDILLGQIINRRYRAAALELAKAKGRHGLTIVIEADSSQALEEIEKVRAAAASVRTELERLPRTIN